MVLGRLKLVPGHLALLERVLEVLAGTAPSLSQLCGAIPKWSKNSGAARRPFSENVWDFLGLRFLFSYEGLILIFL